MFAAVLRLRWLAISLVVAALPSFVHGAQATAPVAASAASAPAAEVVGAKASAIRRAAGAADNGAPDEPLWIKGRSGLRAPADDKRHLVSLGDYVILSVDSPLKDLLALEKPTNRLGLFISDMYFKDLAPMPVPGREKAIMFKLVRTGANQDQWAVLFTRKGKGGNSSQSCDVNTHDGIALTAGFPDGTQVAPSNWACLEYFPSYWGTAALWVMAAALIGFTVWKAWTTSMIRDVGIPPQGQLGPFSLARFQMALWFVTIVCAVLFAYAVTGDISPVPQGALILMGIGAGTAVSAAAIDVNGLPGTLAEYRQLKKQQAVLEQRVQALDAAVQVADRQADPKAGELRGQLKAAQAEAEVNLPKLRAFEIPASRGFFTDILADGNGVAFHRLQVFAWTMIFWVVFIFTLIYKITLMDFDVTALALMGISGATYLGFKLQEQQKAAGDPSTAKAKAGAAP